MCGIIGHIGKRPSLPILVNGLTRMEYRGYDSAGICVVNPETGFTVVKDQGTVANLTTKLNLSAPEQVGIGHTRWATHGAPTKVNAHPHLDADRKIALVHNGTIDNFLALRKYLGSKGINFVSETDTELLVHLIAHFYQGSLEQAVRQALEEVTGTYGIAVVCTQEPGLIIAAKNGSPLIIGIGEGEHIVASDAAAIIEHTNQVIYLEDGQIASIRTEELKLTTLGAIPVVSRVEEISLRLEEIERNGYDHFMLKEIYEQPTVLGNCLRGRITDGKLHLGALTDHRERLAASNRIIFTGCGTAWHAALIGEYLFEAMTRIPCETEYASEFRYRNPVVGNNTTLIAVSQSGETADTLAALREAKRGGAITLGVVNVVGSAITRENHAGVYLHVGPETGVASTKAFVGQVTVLALLAAHFRNLYGLPQDSSFLNHLVEIPNQIQTILGAAEAVRGIAEQYCQQPNWLYLGRGYNYPVALEGALKLKEISYIHAEGLPAAEMKHGPIALINQGMPVVVLATEGPQYGKIINNISEVKARGGTIIAIATEGDEQIKSLAAHVLYVPKTIEPLQPLLTVIPLQLIAYYAAVKLGRDVDQPRNLAKSVTVE